VHSLRLTIANALERLRLESDTLQRDEAALRAHEDRVVASFDRLRQKEASYKDKGEETFFISLFPLPI
jgi:hypothetical protein